MAVHPNSLANLRPGQIGNKGGRKPQKSVRARAIESFEERVTALEQIIDDKTTRPADRIKALELLYRVAGMDVQKHASTNADGEDIQSEMAPDALRAILLANPELVNEILGNERAKALN